MAGRLLVVAGLTLVWVGLWGDLSWGNLLGGVLIALAVLQVGAPRPALELRRLVPGAAVWYLVRFLRDLVVATLEVARQVFWPVRRLRPAVIAVPMHSRDPELLAVVANSITLTPGTLTVMADDATGTLWVHLLHLPEGGRQGVIEQVQDLERLAARAMSVPLHGREDAGRAPG